MPLTMMFYGPEQYRRYFPDEDSPWASAEWDDHFNEYCRHLESIRPRLSKNLFELFRHGFAEAGLHDATLLSLTLGDAVDSMPTRDRPFIYREHTARARLELLGQSHEFHHVFLMRGDISITSDLVSEGLFGDVNFYELVAPDDKYLQLGLWFANESTLIIRCKHIGYRCRRLPAIDMITGKPRTRTRVKPRIP